MTDQPQGQQPPQQWGAPPPAPPRKSFVARHKILTVLGVLVVLGILVKAVSGGGSSTDAAGSGGAGSAGAAASAATAPAAAAAPAPAAAGVGTPVRDGKFEFTVTAVEPGVPSIGSAPLTRKAQGQFVVVRITVSNIGDQAQTFDQSSQKLVDGQGRKLSSDPTAGIYLDDQNFLAQVNPGNEVQGVIVFDVPAGTVPTSLELHDSFLSGGVTVTL